MCFYVGVAADPYKRFVQHLQLDGSNKEKDAIIRDLKEGGWVPVMEVECRCYGKALAERLETFFIEYYRAAKQPLTNRALTLSDDANCGRNVYEYEQRVLAQHSPSLLYRLLTFVFARKKDREMDEQFHQEYLAITRSRSRSHWPIFIEMRGIAYRPNEQKVEEA
jgi:hypothetical protein